MVVDIRGERATARPGAAGDPKLTISADTADFLRISARDLDPGKALIAGRSSSRATSRSPPSSAEMFGEASRY